MTLKHNKKKNGAIVFEQLLTLAARLAGQKKLNEFEFVLDLTKKHFGPNTALGREKKVLQSIVESCCKENDVEELLKEALNEGGRLDFSRLEKEKISLINEINSKIGQDLFKIPIKNFKLYASAQILVNENKIGYLNTTPEERVKIKRFLKENLTKKDLQEEDVKVDNFTYKILINKFNQKYGPFINEHQKSILSSWIKYLITEDKNILESLLKEKIELVKSVVKSSLKSKSHKAMDYYELLKEADETLKNKDFSNVNEEVVYEVMRYFDLVEELEESCK